MSLQPGDRYAGHTVRALLGHGGTSTVYLVDNRLYRRAEALKILNSEGVDIEQTRFRFDREFSIAHSLNHPNIVSVYAHGEVADALWMTMQYIEGGSGAALIPQGRALPDVPLVLSVLRQIAEGLDYAHSMDVVHRDVKPSNMLIGSAEPRVAVLTDFGIARFFDDSRPLSRHGRVRGSLPYAAPEVLQAQQLYPATDTYSLAAATVEFLTGKPPFPLPNSFAIVHAHISKPPPRISTHRRWLPRSVDVILAKALAKNPAERYSSCVEFVELMANALRDIPSNLAVDVPKWHRWRP